MSNNKTDKEISGTFGLGCIVITFGALLLVVAIAIFFGIAWGFLSFAVFFVALGILFAAAAIHGYKQKKQRLTRNMTTEGDSNNDRN